MLHGELRERISTSLFPESPEGPSAGRWHSVLLAICFLGAASLVQLLRLGDRIALNTIWAEDGLIILNDALTKSLPEAVFSPYAGYLIVVPRLIGEVASAFPIIHAAAVIAGLSALVTAIAGLIVWHASAGLIPNPWLRGLLTASTVLVPVAGLESVTSAAYVIWYMLIACFWILFWRPRSKTVAALAGFFMLLTGLSTPGLWFFAPLAITRFGAIKDARDALILGGYGLGSLVQVPIFLTREPESVLPQWTADIWTAFSQRVVDGALLGETLGGHAWAEFGSPFLIALLVLFAATLMFAWSRSDSTARCFAALCLPLSLVMFIASVYQRAVGSALVWPDGSFSGIAGRYAMVPSLIIISVLLVLAARLRSRARIGGLSFPAAGYALILLLAVVTSFKVGDTAARGTPSWTSALRAGALECRQEAITAVYIPTSPPGFGMELSCTRLGDVEP